MQCNIRKKTHISYEYKKNSPKRYKIVSNLKISLLGDIFNLTSFNISSKLTILQQSFSDLSLWETQEPQLKGLCLGN